MQPWPRYGEHVCVYVCGHGGGVYRHAIACEYVYVAVWCAIWCFILETALRASCFREKLCCWPRAVP